MKIPHLCSGADYYVGLVYHRKGVRKTFHTRQCPHVNLVLCDNLLWWNSKTSLSDSSLWAQKAEHCASKTTCVQIENSPVRFLFSVAVIYATNKQFFSQQRLSDIIILKCIKDKTWFCFLFFQAKVAKNCKDNFAFEITYSQNCYCLIIGG